MKAVMIRDGELLTEDRQAPTPGPGQVLVKSLACGICGSDLHALHHPEEMAELGKAIGLVEPDATGTPPALLGHEYCAEVVSYGPETRGDFPVGARVCAIPFLIDPNAGPLGMKGIGFSSNTFGAMSEYFVLQEDFLLPVPDGLPDAGAAVAEPLAVAIHFVSRGEVQPEQTALVIGCGTIGLVTIAALKMRGVERIIASDPVADRRGRALAMGAGQVVDPGAEDPVAVAAAIAAEAGAAPLAILECAGVLKLIPELIDKAPQHARIVIGGVHTAPVPIHPGVAMMKELDLRFAFAYTPEEYAEALRALGDGRADWRSVVTGRVGVDRVADAFKDLSGPTDHVKVIVEPWRNGPLEPYARA